MASQNKILTLDMGNSVISGGIWEGDVLVGSKWALPSSGGNLPSLLEARLREIGPLDRAIMASVVPHLEKTILVMVKKECGIVTQRLSWRTLTGMKLAVRRPSQVGADRIANAVAAFRQKGGPILVLDIGTAITCDAVSADYKFIGGAIAPGPRLLLGSLSHTSELLPELEPQFGVPALGRDTQGAMHAGVFWGLRGAIGILITQLKRELGWGRETKVAVTGGYAAAILKDTPLIKKVDPLLTLRGLRRIAEHPR